MQRALFHADLLFIVHICVSDDVDFIPAALGVSYLMVCCVPEFLRSCVVMFPPNACTIASEASKKPESKSHLVCLAAPTAV